MRTWWGCGEIVYVRTGQKKHRNFTSENNKKGEHRIKRIERMQDMSSSVSNQNP